MTGDCAAAPGTATALADCTAVAGTLTCSTNQTGKTVSVPIVDDAVEDGGETFTRTLAHFLGRRRGAHRCGGARDH